jgi:hypothetical protein
VSLVKNSKPSIGAKFEMWSQTLSSWGPACVYNSGGETNKEFNFKFTVETGIR